MLPATSCALSPFVTASVVARSTTAIVLPPPWWSRPLPCSGLWPAVALTATTTTATAAAAASIERRFIDPSFVGGWTLCRRAVRPRSPQGETRQRLPHDPVGDERRDVGRARQRGDH